MAEIVEHVEDDAEATGPGGVGLCMCESYARVTEAAALAGARWLGRADQDAAERDATQAMCDALGRLPIDGRIVIGSEDEESPLAIGRNVGGGGRSVDLARADADVFLVELKAAAIDVVAEAAAARGVRLVLADNDVVSLAGEPDVDALLEALAPEPVAP